MEREWNIEDIMVYINERLGISYRDNIDETYYIMSGNKYDITITDNEKSNKYDVTVKDNENFNVWHEDVVSNYRQLEAVIMQIKNKVLPSIYDELVK